MFKTGLEGLVEKTANAGAIALPGAIAGPGIGARMGAALRGAGRTLRRGALLAGVGGAGALALGAGAQHERDKKRDKLVYAPMSGGFFT